MTNLVRLQNLVEDATGRGPNKWTANAKLWEWFRSDPEAVVQVLLAANAVRCYPGGQSNACLYQALDRLPEVAK